MSIQCIDQSLDASATVLETRSAPATSDSAIDLDEDARDGSATKKRKRDAGTVDELLKDSFVVKPYPPRAPVKTRTLQPLLLLARSQLPLSSLDILSSSNPLPPSRLFETHIKILELEGRIGTEPVVLIARLDDGRSLYAVEREDRGLYVICKLGSWVNLRNLRASASASWGDELNVPGNKSSTNPLAQLSSIQPAIAEPARFSKKKRLAIEAIQSMVKRPSTTLLTDSQTEPLVVGSRSDDVGKEIGSETQVPPESQNGTGESQPLDDGSISQPNAADIFENIRTHYFDALYLSKASLAYFAKGPLSRARAAFHLDYDSSLEMNDLVEFLQGLVMTTTVMEKKYKDGLPNTIALIDIEDHSVEESVKAKAGKKRTSKKMKLGKNGLYPMEADSIRKWWANHDEEFEVGIPGRTREDFTKSRLAHLRIRETQLQMILILEVLALKPLAASVEDHGASLPGDAKAIGDDKHTKPKKLEQLSSLMDSHIDRLCIWQSISSETVKSTDDNSQTSTAVSKHLDNITKDFCVDIIAPFFSSRLPDQCASINRKLGGPLNISPPKAKLSRSASASARLSKPGAATKRPVPVKSSQSLSRVLTDERERERRSASAQPNRKLSLMRAATMPVMPGLKREDSEAPSLSSIPSLDSVHTSSLNKSGFTSTKRFGHREVDFASLTRDTSTRVNKQAQIDNELKLAIDALKKPNRELAGKTFADTAEKRAVAVPLSRKSKKPVRNPLFDSVQISATPKASRLVDKVSKSQIMSTPGLDSSQFDMVIPPSSLPAASGSSFASQERPIRNPFSKLIQATPTKKSTSASQMPGLDIDFSPVNQRRPPVSPRMPARRSSAALFATVPESAIKESTYDFTNRNLDSFILQETPMKKKQRSPDTHCHPAMAEPDSEKENDKGKDPSTGKNATANLQTQGENIYKTLGWDDDFDDLI